MSSVEVTKVDPRSRDDASAPRATTGETVTVGCKMPNGLILQNYKFEEKPEAAQGGGYIITKIARPDGDAITLNGCSINVGNVAHGIMPDHLMIGGYGLTSGVPKDFWDRWYEANKNTLLVKNRVVFVARDDRSASSQARELANNFKSGLEPLDPENLPKGLFGQRRFAGGSLSGLQQASGNDVDNL